MRTSLRQFWARLSAFWYARELDSDFNEEIESHLAHLEHQFDKLNEVVIEQGRLLKKIQTHQQRIAQTVESIRSCAALLNACACTVSGLESSPLARTILRQTQ